jgi:DsbC/DsbD-like thiol-disulfide interchange protein
MRLLLSVSEDGRLSGGVEMLIEPGWHTYWRNPGETGITPEFDFSDSSNVASVEVLYPAPERYNDGGSVSLIYRDQVVFPLIVTPVRADEPVVLRVSAEFGVCSEICVPTRANSELTAPVGAERDPLAEARVSEFIARVPRQPEPGRLDIEAVTVVGKALLVDVRMPDSSYRDLFADPPAGWYIGQPELVARAAGVSRYRLSLADAPHGDTLERQTFRFVAVAGGDAIEETFRIR